MRRYSSSKYNDKITMISDMWREREKGRVKRRDVKEREKGNSHFSECIIYFMEIVIDFHFLMLTYIR